MQRGRDDVRIMVRFPEDDRRSLSSLESMNIRLPDGTEVPPYRWRSYPHRGQCDSSHRWSAYDQCHSHRQSHSGAPDQFGSAIQRGDSNKERYPDVAIYQAGEAEERAKSLEGLVGTGLMA